MFTARNLWYVQLCVYVFLAPFVPFYFPLFTLEHEVKTKVKSKKIILHLQLSVAITCSFASFSRRRTVLLVTGIVRPSLKKKRKVQGTKKKRCTARMHTKTIEMFPDYKVSVLKSNYMWLNSVKLN